MFQYAVRISETSVNFNVTTRRYISEDSELHTRLRENLKSHMHLKRFSVDRASFPLLFISTVF
jgi:hypothetical protein